MSLNGTSILATELEAPDKRRERKHATDEGQIITKNDRTGGSDKYHPEQSPIEHFGRGDIVFADIECEAHRGGGRCSIPDGGRALILGCEEV